MFYLGTPNVSPPPNFTPSFPYLTMKAKGKGPAGSWVKQKDIVPFRTKPNTYYSITASPGQVVENGAEHLQLFSATTRKPGNPCVQRTMGIARTKNLDGQNCTWSKKCIGLPSVLQVGSRLALFYDAPGGNSTIHMKRDIDLAWLDLPSSPPAQKKTE